MRNNRTMVVGMICLLYFSVACQQKPPEEETPHTVEYTGTIVAMGDSLTEGLGVTEENAYPAQLERALRARGFNYRVINAGISGETSSGARSRLDWVMTLKPDILILETGANDGLRGLDTGLIEKNIRYIIEKLIQNEIVVVLAGMKMVANMGPAYTQAFKEVYTRVGRSEKVILVPFFLEGVAGDAGMNQADGIHPTVEGYEKVVQNILPFVIQAVKQHQNMSE